MRAEQEQHNFMRKNLLGRTGILISELAFGGGVTGGILIDADEATREAALARAVAAGINWIDTAPVYGNGVSEETIGRHLARLSPRPHVSTKVRLEADDLGDIAGAIERSLERSLRRLRSDRVTLLQLHNHLGAGAGLGARIALRPEQVLGRGGAADTFDRLRQQGLIHAAGMTVAGDTKACLEVVDSGRFDTAQVYCNAINPSAAWRQLPAGWQGGQDFCGVLAACARQNMGVLNIRVWAGGVLASPARPERLFVMTSNTDTDNEVRCAAAVRAALGDGYGTPAQAALRFVLGNNGFDTRVVGITTIEQLDVALAALARGPLPEAAVSKLEALWAGGFGSD
jgi:L-galactose dehydrogenase/L-glyceraldehyde 3-phosphate reductase